MRSFSQRKYFASSTGNIAMIVGNNSRLTLTMGAIDTAALDASPMPDPMRVQSFGATLIDRSTAGAGYPLLGAYLHLGKLTGLLSGDAVEWITTGIIGGNGGQLWVKAPFPFLTEYGLVVYVPASLTSRDYVLYAGGTHE